MVIGFLSQVIDYVSEKSTDRLALRGKPLNDSREKKEFLSLSRELDSLIADFCLGVNQGFAYRLPDNQRIAESLIREHIGDFYERGKRISESMFIDTPNSTYFQLERI